MADTLPNISESQTAVLLNESSVPSEHYKNTSEIDNDVISAEWYLVLEAVLVGFCALIGLGANIAVIHGSVKAKRSTRQNVYLFIGLALSDYFVCFIRGPSLIYIIFHTKNSPDLICEMWMFSTIFLIVDVMTNTIIAIERGMIMHQFQRYLSLFTPRRVFVVIVTTWISVIGCFISFYKGTGFVAKFLPNERSCLLTTTRLDVDKIGSLLVRACAVVIFGVIPIVIQTVCYISIVCKVCKAETLKSDKCDDKIAYTRITGIAFARVLVTVTCLLPVLTCFAIGPLFPEVYYTNVRFLDNLIIVYATISPFISMHDADFRDKFFHWIRRCSAPFKRRTGSKKGSRRSNYITSADLKTFE